MQISQESKSRLVRSVLIRSGQQVGLWLTSPWYKDQQKDVLKPSDVAKQCQIKHSCFCSYFLSRKDWDKVESFSQTNQKFDILLGNHEHCVLCSKGEWDYQASCQLTVQKLASLMVRGFVSVFGMGSWPLRKDSINTLRSSNFVFVLKGLYYAMFTFELFSNSNMHPLWSVGGSWSTRRVDKQR